MMNKTVITNPKREKKTQELLSLLLNKSLFFLIVVSIISFLVNIDQLTKEIALKQFVNKPYQNWFIKFGIVKNFGATFGMFSGKTTFLLILISITISILFICLFFAQSKVNALSFIFLISGAIGNLIDRFYHDGGVIDFINLPFLPWIMKNNYFNIADITIICGVILLFTNAFINTFINYREEKKEMLQQLKRNKS